MRPIRDRAFRSLWLLVLGWIGLAPGMALGQPQSPRSVAELARSLKGDPDLIYQHVRNHIEFYPVWGVHKGAFGALIEGKGTAFDQALLLRDVLRAAGHVQAHVVKGTIRLTGAQAAAWLGVPVADGCTVIAPLRAGRIPVIASDFDPLAGVCGALTWLEMAHAWVSVPIDGRTYAFDPAYKPRAVKPRVDLATITGYRQDELLGAARSGATLTAESAQEPESVRNLGRAALREKLAAYAGRLATDIRKLNPHGALHDVLGGAGPIEPYWGGSLRQVALPYQTGPAPMVLTEGDTVAASSLNTYKTALRVRFAGIDETLTTDQLYGARLSISFASNVPQLRLDGALRAQGSHATAGTVSDLTLEVTYRGTEPARSESATLKLSVGDPNVYVITNGWGPTGAGSVQHFTTRLQAARGAAGNVGAEASVGPLLAVVSSEWLGHVSAAHEIADRVGGQRTTWRHALGVVGLDGGALYIDSPAYGRVVSPFDGNATQAGFFSDALFADALEGRAVQRIAGGAALSAVGLVDRVVAGGKPVYGVTAMNLEKVRSRLEGCSSYDTQIGNYIERSGRLVLAGSCLPGDGPWEGIGFFAGDAAFASARLQAVMRGRVQGAGGAQPVTPPNAALLGGTLDGSPGSFTLGGVDISVGTGAFPYGLALRRGYSSGSIGEYGAFGRGWSHDLGGSAIRTSAGVLALGARSALDAVAQVVTHMVVRDLMADTERPLDKFVTSILAVQWASEQLTDSAVVVRVGMGSETFVRLPDGSYNPPPGSSARLTTSLSGNHVYETKERTTLAFNSAGELESYTLKNGMRARFIYDGGRVASVTNSLGRSITLAYDRDGRVTSATARGRRSDAATAGRTVSYGYAGGDLARFTDATRAVSTYKYDAAGRLTRMFLPAAPSTAVLTNTYDTLGRLSRQTDAIGKTTRFYFAGSRTEVEAPLGVRQVTFFDGRGLPVRSIDPLGRVTLAEYDAAARPRRVTLPEGGSVEYTYDDASCAREEKRCTHNVLSVVQRPKPDSTLPTRSTLNTYEPVFNRLATTTNPRGQVTRYAYHGTHGELATITLPAASRGAEFQQILLSYGGYTVTGWPTFHLPTSESRRIDNAVNQVVTTRDYDAGNGHVPKTVVVDAGTGRLGLTTTYTFDADGNLTRIDGPLAGSDDSVVIAYDAQRRVAQVTDPALKASRRFYDANGRPIRSARQFGARWEVACTEYDAAGRLARMWGPALMASDQACPAASDAVPEVSQTYDDLGRPLARTARLPSAFGGPRTTTHAYFADGRPESVTSGAGAEATTVRYAYTSDGRLAGLTDGRGNASAFEYDGFGRVVKVRYPARGAGAGTVSEDDYDEYGYDANDNVVRQRLRSGAAVTLAYDALDRPTAVTYPTAADRVTYSYDLLGRQLSASRSDHAITYAWDNAGRLLSTTAGGRRLAYQYDAAGNRTRLTWPDGFYVSTSYDALGRPTSIRENGTVDLVVRYAYDDLSRRVSMALGNVTGTSYVYGAAGALSAIAHDLAGAAHDVSFGLARNQALEVVNRTVSSPNAAYLWTPTAAASRTYESNGLNQYTRVSSGTASGATLSYDGRGNLTGDGTWRWVYDEADRLTSATRTGTSVALAYDALGRLRQETLNGSGVTELLYDGADLVAEYDGAGRLVRRHVHGPGVDEPIVSYDGAGNGSKAWLYADQQGSIVATADTAGAGTAAQGYGPFGEPSVTTGSRFKYTGQAYLPSLGLLYYKARFYSPTLGRFMQPDPIGYADGPNRYAYVGNDPVNLTDPTGLFAVRAPIGCSAFCYFDDSPPRALPPENVPVRGGPPSGPGGPPPGPGGPPPGPLKWWQLPGMTPTNTQLPKGVPMGRFILSDVVGYSNPMTGPYVLSPGFRFPGGQKPVDPVTDAVVFVTVKGRCFGLDCVGTVQPSTGNVSGGFGATMPLGATVGFANVRVEVPNPLSNANGGPHFGLSVNAGVLNKAGIPVLNRYGVAAQLRVNFPIINPNACIHADQC